MLCFPPLVSRKTKTTQDPILGVSEMFHADTDPSKMLLGTGAYRDDSGKPLVLECVRQAEKKLIEEAKNMEYLPTQGDNEYISRSVRLAYGKDVGDASAIAGVQTLSGTGACRLFAEFIARFKKGAVCYVPDPTWSNHLNIFRDAGVETKSYRYYKAETRGLDFDGLKEDLGKAKEGDVVLLHACAHNPTGVDPSEDEWVEISKLFKEKNLFPFLDSAYQGFASGDCDKDAFALRMFKRDGHAMALAQSFAKNMGLYGHRVGTLSMVCASKEEAKVVESQLKVIARAMYSSPPLQGANLVSTILGDEKLNALWLTEVKMMADRIIDMRSKLREALEKSGSTLRWKHVTDQIGMFCYSGLTPEQVDRLKDEHHIYMTRNGRISMAGVTSKTVERLAQAMHAVTSSS